MMSNFRMWYIENQDAITWFLIGLLVSNGFTNLGRGAWGWAIFDFALAFLNFGMRKHRLS